MRYPSQQTTIELSDGAALRQSVRATPASLSDAIRSETVALSGEASGYLDSRAKRALDIIGASVIILALSPVFLVVGVGVLASSPGPVCFVQRRTGARGREFAMLKFRSMVVGSDRGEYRQATRDDPRVTAVGRIIRKTSVDELPQLINVLKGDMSLVGPRPHPVALDAQYVGTMPGYGARYRARPGITGLAQVNGARGETPTAAHMRQRLDHDVEYVHTASLAGDLRILLRTVREVFASASAF